MDALPKTYNIYNVKDLNEFCEGIASHSEKEHVQKWFRTTFKSWLRVNTAHLRRIVMLTPDVELMHGYLTGKQKRQLKAECVFFSAEPEEQWAKDALVKHELYKFVTNGQQDTYKHWADYADTLPDGHISMTADVMIEKVKAWDASMAVEVLVKNRDEGTIPIAELSGDHYVVRLSSKKSYDNESDLMHHCVRRYYARGRTIFSLRSRSANKPLLTIEYTPAYTVRTLTDKGECFEFKPGVLGQMEKAYRYAPTAEDFALVSELLKKIEWDDSALIHWLMNRNGTKPFYYEVEVGFAMGGTGRISMSGHNVYQTNHEESQLRPTELFPENKRAVSLAHADGDGKCVCGNCNYDSIVDQELDNGRGVRYVPSQLTTIRNKITLESEIQKFLSNKSSKAEANLLLDYEQALGRLHRGGPMATRALQMTYRPAPRTARNIAQLEEYARIFRDYNMDIPIEDIIRLEEDGFTHAALDRAARRYDNTIDRHRLMRRDREDQDDDDDEDDFDAQAPNNDDDDEGDY